MSDRADRASEHEERARFFELSADMMCVAGFDGIFRAVSPSVKVTLGYDANELVGKPYSVFVHPEDLDASEQETKALASAATVETHLFRNRFRRRDGDFCWLEWHSTAIATEQLIFAIARDVTKQVAIEKKALLYAVELERSNAELQQFAYVASHDLQEPLRAVAGCVHMLEEHNEGRLDDRSVELVAYAVDGAKRLQALINDLLALSKVGTKGISRAWIDPCRAAEKAIAQLESSINESNAVIRIASMPLIFADGVQLTQLFQNLIGNAIKFRANDRRPEVCITAERVDNAVVLSVRDNGIGIAPQYRDRVFGIFQRLNSRRVYAGTGIGLAICKKIAERHEGKIWIEPTPVENGTVFRVSIPNGQVTP